MESRHRRKTDRGEENLLETITSSDDGRNTEKSEQAQVNQSNMETMRSTKDINCISAEGEKKPTCEDYQNYKAVSPPPPPSQNKDFLNLTGISLPNTSVSSGNSFIRDPRLKKNKDFKYTPLQGVTAPLLPLTASNVEHTANDLSSIGTSHRLPNPFPKFHITSEPRGSIDSIYFEGSHEQRCSSPPNTYKLLKKILECVDDDIISWKDALIIILTWPPIWLQEVVGQACAPPPIFTEGEKTTLKSLSLVYDDTTDVFTTIFPLLMYDLFYRMWEFYTHLKGESMNTYELDVSSIVVTGNVVEIKSQTLLSENSIRSYKGFLAIVTFTLVDGRKKDYFGYIVEQKICTDIPTNLPPNDILHLKIQAMCNLSNINTKAKISVFIFYPLWRTLIQIKALSSIDGSPLRDIIFHPRSSTCSKLDFEMDGNFNWNSPRTKRHALRDIKLAIALDKPEIPKIAVVDATVGSDLISTLVANIIGENKGKLGLQKYSILVCCRNSKQLEKLALQITSAEGRKGSFTPLNTVILEKAKLLPNQLEKFSLENKVHECMHPMKNENADVRSIMPVEPFVIEKNTPEAEKYILETSDVIISTIFQPYDKIVSSIFGVGKKCKFSLCIIDESYSCTEPESFLPLSYGMNKLILTGDPKIEPNVKSLMCSEYDYYMSLPFRISKVLDLQ